MKGIVNDTSGFSSPIDALLFLILVSACGVLLAPAIVGSNQISALHDLSAAEHNSQILLTLMNGRVEDFSYAAAGDLMDCLVNQTLGADAVDSDIYQTGKKLVAGRELKHKTFADISSESVASQFNIYYDGNSIRLNVLTDEYRDNMNTQMRDYLDQQIGDRYYYNVSVVWRPFMDVPVGGETSIGPGKPDHAYVESAWITMPYHTEFTRYHVETLIEGELNALGMDLENSGEISINETEAMISERINAAVNRTVDDAVEIIVEMTFGKTLESTQTALDQQIDNVVPGNNSGISDVIVEEIIEQLKSDPVFIENASRPLSEQIADYLKQIAKEEVHKVTRDDVNELALDIAQQYTGNAATMEEIREQVVDYVFSRLNIHRARITLAIWDRNV